MRSSIPRRIHYIWVGGPMPPDREAYLSTWRTANPHFEIVRWDENNIDFSLCPVRQAYAARNWAKVADIVRLSVVLEHGGIYLDTDFRLFRPLDKLLQQQCFFGFQTQAATSDWVANGAFGAVPNHWFIRECFTQILAMKPSRLGLVRPTTFGPKLVTRLLKNFGLSHYSADGVYVRDVYLLPTQVFYPFSRDERFTQDCIASTTLGAHMWAESEGREPTWVASLPRPIRFIRRTRNTMRAAARKFSRYGRMQRTGYDC